MLVLAAGLGVAAPTMLSAGQPSRNPEFWSPLGLPRLKTNSKPGKPAPLAANGYGVDGLNVPPNAKAAVGIRVVERGTIRVLELEATREWVRPLQKAGKDPLCVSFLIYASDATVLAVDGAWLGVAASPVSGCLQLMIGEPAGAGGGLKWREAGINVMTRIYGGETMAALPVLTVRLDPKAGVWDLYSGSTQVADNIVLAKTAGSDANNGNFIVRAGKGRAWMCGLVQTGDNPLFGDANGNGIDDEFERTKKGGLLPSTLTPAQRASAAKEWRETARTQRYEAWLIGKPRPD